MITSLAAKAQLIEVILQARSTLLAAAEQAIFTLMKAIDHTEARPCPGLYRKIPFGFRWVGGLLWPLGIPCTYAFQYQEKDGSQKVDS
jgi:hypothetical protein